VTSTRDRRDRCPGVLRPWPAADGLLVRLRLVGGRLPVASLQALLDVADRLGDGRVHVTGRANLQVRGLPGRDGRLTDEAVEALRSTGLVPSLTHDLVRNVMVSPQTGLAGGHLDLRPVAARLDRELQSDPALSTLPGRFLFVLDDGRGDLIDRTCDLGMVALTDRLVQLRLGEGLGAVVSVGEAPARLVALAQRFQQVRGEGPHAAWHVSELSAPLAHSSQPDRRLPRPALPLPYGLVPGGRHVPWPETGLTSADLPALACAADLVVTPWHGVLVPGGPHD
jgi:precorrin-3B synthase